MSFNAKNLSYEAKEPSFLRKLRADYSGGDPSRHERPMTRPKKQKDNQDDDGPTYVDADSQDTISKADFEHLMGHQEVLNRNEKTQEKRDHEDTPLETAGDHHAKADDTVRTEQKIAKVGTQRKRKAVKVVGDGIQDPTEVERATCAAKTDEKKRPPKKKKVKLSFVDETEE